ncbi:X motif 6 [Seminavis robusta]|uniref:X motif 6 n=1 Tax=Seminavis robusta TaxID=568900 RepID=A0A9N8DKQ7_9STRA|nr:X motif 6 [Seminavis robusta]|eukprot:Sro134_g063250.1 X motif 6 (292) ;mRNA; r:1042-1917
MNDNDNNEDDWQYLLPFEDWSHNSVRITIPQHTDDQDEFEPATFPNRLHSTVQTLRQMEKSSVWVNIHISRSSLITDMADQGFQFHHAQGDHAVLNLWLRQESSLVPEFATHHIGVGGIVINSRDEILCVREQGKNFLPWKIPGGLSHLGEHIDQAAVREVLEETGIQTTFRNVLCFRHTHGLANGRSDIYFVCRLDPIEQEDVDGTVIIPEPVPQEAEIAATAWVPYDEFADMVHGEQGHPMISHVLNLLDRGDAIERTVIPSIVPGRRAAPIYSSPVISEEETKETKQS